MLSETVFRSMDVSAGDRFDYWSELFQRTHAPMELFSDRHDDFRAYQRVLNLGAVTVWPATLPSVRFRRTTRLIRQSDPERFHLSLRLSGTMRVERDGVQGEFGPYDVCVIDTSRPFECESGIGLPPDSAQTGVGLEIPKSQLPPALDRIDELMRCRLSGRDGIGSLLVQFLSQLTAKSDSYRPSDGPRLARVVVDLVSALFAHALDSDARLDPETERRALTLRIQGFIRQHLHEPELAPGAIAAAHHISLSHLHRLFQERGITVAGWMRRERLEQCRRDLGDPLMVTTPIHVIAGRWGFTHVAHFSRAFRRAYEMTPREYRGRAVGMAGGPV
ncbi:helix-turn-helix domain-containing protein [Streptomyces sp. NBC_00459]|uniref:helix-turn-helix domain-containing protein n=1 Tax=Streptomyces sp. NBC_00459 TaxID=2975749 RepID=UPI003FA70B6A